MIKKLLSVLILFVLYSFITKPVSAQVNYEDVVEKIHFTDPQRRGKDGQLLEATKKVGSSNPILRVYIYGDLNEIYTKKFFDESFNELKKIYSEEVVFIYKHNPFMIQDKSVFAGMIGECAAAQGKFWENIEPILNNVNNLENFSYLKNIDILKFKECLSNPLTKTLVKTSGDDSRLFGGGVPTIIVQNTLNTEGYDLKIMGAQDISIFRRAFLEAKEGDLNKKDLEDIKLEVSELRQETKQVKQDLERTKMEQTRFSQELEKIKTIISSILEKIKNLFK